MNGHKNSPSKLLDQDVVIEEELSPEFNRLIDKAIEYSPKED